MKPQRTWKDRLYDPRIRGLLWQLLVFVGVAVFFLWIGNNTATNLERQGIASGFGFLTDTTGFDITMALIPYDESSSYGWAFVVSVINTLLVSILGIFFATILGFLIGVARLSSNWLLAKIAEVYVEIVRNVPLLLQIFFWYFAVLRALPGPRNSLSLGETIFLNIRGLYVPRPVTDDGFGLVWLALGTAFVAAIVIGRFAKQRRLRTGEPFPAGRYVAGLLIGLPIAVFFLMGRPLHWDIPALAGFNFQGGLVLIPELVSLLLALTIYTASFIAEIVRAGILAVAKGQTEAALSLGLTQGQTLKLVIIPQALRVIIPPLTSQYLNLTKNSSLAAAIAYPDLVLVFAGTVLMQTGQAVEVICMTMAVYLFISLCISLGMNFYNRKMALVER